MIAYAAFLFFSYTALKAIFYLIISPLRRGSTSTNLCHLDMPFSLSSLSLEYIYAHIYMCIYIQLYI